MRKINRIKKVVAFFLVMILGINVQCMSGNAAGKIEKQMLSYLESVLPQYLAVDEVRVGEYKVSEPITLYNWETGESEKHCFWFLMETKWLVNLWCNVTKESITHLLPQVMQMF